MVNCSCNGGQWFTEWTWNFLSQARGNVKPQMTDKSLEMSTWSTHWHMGWQASQGTSQVSGKCCPAEHDSRGNSMKDV